MDRESFSKIDAAILLAVASGLGYGIAYLYELNYLRFYNLPSVFLDLSVNTIVRPVLLIATLVFIILMADSITLLKPIHLLQFLRNKYNSYFLLAILFITLIIGAGYLGKSNASKKEDYLVINKKDGLYVAVYNYKENLIIAPLDMEKGLMSLEFELVEIKSIKESQIVKFKDGLKVEKVKSNTKYR